LAASTRGILISRGAIRLLHIQCRVAGHPAPKPAKPDQPDRLARKLKADGYTGLKPARTDRRICRRYRVWPGASAPKPCNRLILAGKGFMKKHHIRTGTQGGQIGRRFGVMPPARQNRLWP
jgi:hypothetical protein